MKRWLPAVAGVVVLLVGLWLSMPVMEPEYFTGIWYSGQGNNVYSFEDGLIYSWDESAEDNKERKRCGAYIYCADSVYLFVQEMEGLEREQELYLIREKGADRLSTERNGMGITYFRRSLDIVTGE